MRNLLLIAIIFECLTGGGAPVPPIPEGENIVYEIDVNGDGIKEFGYLVDVSLDSTPGQLPQWYSVVFVLEHV